MGILSFAKSLVGKAADTGKKAAAAVGKKLVEWGGKLSDKFSKETASAAQSIGKESQYTASDTRAVIDITTELSHYIKKIEVIADEIEKKCIEECNSYYLDIIEFFEDSGLEVELKALQNYINETQRSLKGYLKKLISKNVSVDNPKCVAVLALKPGLEKTEKVEEFQREVFKECLGEMCRRIDGVISKQNKYIQKNFDNIFSKIEKQHNTMVEDFEKLEHASKSNEDIKKQEIVSHHLLVAHCDYVLSELEP